MTDSEKRRRLTPGCNCVHFQAIADKQKGAVTFICPVHGCATLDNRPLPVGIPPTSYVDVRSTTIALTQPEPTGKIIR